MEEMVRNDKFSHLLEFNTVNEFLHFDVRGDLMARGKEQYWREVNALIKKLDCKETNLRPEANQSGQKVHLHQHMKHIQQHCTTVVMKETKNRTTRETQKIMVIGERVHYRNTSTGIKETFSALLRITTIEL